MEGVVSVVRALPRGGGFPPPPRDDDEGGKARPFCLDDDGGVGCSYIYIYILRIRIEKAVFIQRTCLTSLFVPSHIMRD